MDLLTEEVGFISEKNFSSLNLPQIEYQCRNFLRGGASSIGEALQKIPEGSSLIDYVLQNLFFVGLERQVWDFSLPIQEIFNLWASGVARYLSAPITDWARILVELLDLTSSDLQALAMVPRVVSRDRR